MTPHKGLCTLFDRGKYIWNGNPSSDKKDKIEKVKRCRFSESRATNCISNRFNRPLNNKHHCHCIEKNWDGIKNSRKNCEFSVDVKKRKITRWKCHNVASYSDGKSGIVKYREYCDGNCCKSKVKFYKDSKLNQIMKKKYQRELWRKSDCNQLSTDINSLNHHHYQHATGHCTKDQCDKLESLDELDVPHHVKLSSRQNYSLCPGAKNVNELLAPGDNESHTCQYKTHQHSENCEKFQCNLTSNNFEIANEKSIIADNIEIQVSTDDEFYMKKKFDLLEEIPEIPTTLLLHRSRSLPQLSLHDSGVESVHDNKVPPQRHSKLVNDLRQLLTLKQHYYPEGGWGWLILFVCILIQILSYGIHGAVGVLITHVAKKFKTDIYLEAGLSYGIFVLRCVGVWYSDEKFCGWKSKVYIGYTVFIFSVMYSFTLSQFIMLHNSINNLNEFIDAFFMLVMLFVISSKMVNIIVKRKVITGMIKKLGKYPFNPQDTEEMDINSKSADNIKFCTLMYGIMTESTCTMLILASLNRDVPRKELPYKVWLPFNITTPTTYWIAYLHQIIGLYIAANMDIGFDSLVIDMMMMTRAQLKILKHRFNKIQELTESNVNYSTDEFSVLKKIHLEKQLIANCTKHHIAIFELVFLQYCAGSLILCASTFSVSQLKPFSADFIALVIYVMCILIQIFIYCRYAHEVTLESESIGNALYTTNWTSLSITTQKYLIIIMPRMLQPIKYTVGHITLSLDSFTGLIKLSFSAYNVLQQVSE